MARYTKDEALEWARESLRGQWTTLMTPFTPDDELDEAGLRGNIRHVRRLGTTGAGCTWGMGEFWSLTREERLRVYDVVSDEAAGDLLIGAHVTHTSAGEMLILADHARAVGFDLLIVAPPYIVTKTEAQVVDYVRLLADATPLAIMFYNSPQFGIVMSAQGLAQICDIPNVVGVKEASFDRQLTIDTHRLLGRTAIISAPDEWVLFKGRELGFQQQVMFANTSDWRFDRPGANYYVQFIDRATQGDIDDELYERRIQPIKALSDRWWQRTVQRFNGALPVSMCKYWGELMGMAGGHVRRPLGSLAPEEKDELKRDLEGVRTELPATVGEHR
jgi:4-hydroxy-tetrahydrodipicolinate synthase